MMGHTILDSSKNGFFVEISDPIYLYKIILSFVKGKQPALTSKSSTSSNDSTTPPSIYLIFKISLNLFQLVVRDNALENSFQIWAQWPLTVGFTDGTYRHSETKDEILGIIVDCALLEKCLRSSLSSKSASSSKGLSTNGHSNDTEDFTSTFSRLFIKCQVPVQNNSENNAPSASITIISEKVNMSGKKLRLNQTLACVWLSDHLLHDLKEPMIPFPQMHVYMEKIQILKSMLERVKLLTKEVTFIGKKTNPNIGDLNIVVKNSTSESSLKLAGLKMPATPNENTSQDGNNVNLDSVSVTVSIYELLRCLQCYLLYPKAILFGILNELALVVYVHWPPAILTYFIPHRSE